MIRDLGLKRRESVGFYLNLLLNYQNFALYEKIRQKKPLGNELFYQKFVLKPTLDGIKIDTIYI